MEVEQDNLKYDSEECGHRSRRRRPNKSYSNLTTQVSSDRNMLRTRKIERKERKNEKNARRKSNRTRTRLTKARAQLAGAPPEDLREVCAWLHMAPRRKNMLSASLRRVWRTQREKDEHMATRTGMPKERRRNFNHMHAFNDIYCRSGDEDEDVELQRKKYSEGVWVETVKTANDLHYKRSSRRRTLYL